jgi:hypothetical protein
MEPIVIEPSSSDDLILTGIAPVAPGVVLWPGA